MKKFLALLTILATCARADTPPPTNITKLKGGATNGLIQTVSQVVAALNCAGNTGYVPTWNGTQFTCQALPASGVSAVTATAPLVSSGGSAPNLTCNVASGSQPGCLSSSDWAIFNGKQASLTIGSLTAAGTDGMVVTGGTSAVIGAGTSLAQHVSDSTHNGYLTSTDWSTFNGKQATLTFGNLTDAGTDGIVVTNGTGAVIGSGTSVAQHVADSTHNGYLLSTDWSTFNSKQASGNYITSLTGGVTASGPGAAVATVVTNANLTGPITSVGNATSIAAQTGTGTTFVVQTSPTLTTPNLGTPTTLVGTNITGTGASFTAGTVTTNANLTGPITSVGNATSVAAQTGTGTTFVMQASPTLTTPNLGTPTTLVGTNITGTGASFTAGTATNATNIATTATNSTNATFFPTFVASSSSGNQGADTATGLTFNPSTNTLTTTTFSGALTGAASLNVLKAGDTMTGALVNNVAGALSTPAVLISGAPITGGSATTTKPQFNVDSGTSNTWSTSGTVAGFNGPTSFAGNLIDAKVAGVRSFVVTPNGVGIGLGLTDETLVTNGNQLVLKGSSTNTQLSLTNPVSTTNFNVGINNTINYLGVNGVVWFRMNNTTTNMSIGYNQTGEYFPWTHARSSTSTTPTSVVINSSTILPPATVNQNNSTTAGNYGLFGNAGGGSNHVLNAWIAMFNDNHTNGSETSHMEFVIANAGTRTVALNLTKEGMLIFGGTAVTLASCGTSPTVTAGSVAQAGKVTVGTIPSGTCTINFNTTFPKAPSCWARDTTTGLNITGDATTTTFPMVGAFVAGDVIAYGCDGNI